MAQSEQSPLLLPNGGRRSINIAQQGEEASSIIDSHVTAEEQKLMGSSVGERLPYNGYTTIDWLHDLVLDLTTCSEHNTAAVRLICTGQRLVPPTFYPR